MKNALIITATAATLALAVTSPSFAVGGPGGAILDPDRFAAIDTNRDGQLSTAEIEADRVARFAQADTNADGELSAEEMTAQVQGGNAERAAKRAARMISHLDEDGDGALTLAEMAASTRAERMFSRIDEDGDGQLSTAEVEAAREHIAERGHGHGWGHGKDHGEADE